MALLLNNYRLSNGLVSNYAYIKIDTINGDKENLNIDIKVYVSRDASQNGTPYIEQIYERFSPDTTAVSLNYHKQAYEYLKTLEKYFDAIDVLE